MNENTDTPPNKHNIYMDTRLIHAAHGIGVSGVHNGIVFRGRHSIPDHAAERQTQCLTGCIWP